MPRQFSPWGLVDRNATLVGEIGLADLTRLQDAVKSVDALSYVIKGQRDLSGSPSLAIQIAGQLNISCERCLQDMAFAINCDSTLQLKTTVQAATRSGEHELTDDCEVLAVDNDEKLDAFDLLQDEILLALPLVAAHSDIQDCGSKVVDVIAAVEAVSEATDDNSEVEPTSKPFAGLADLLGAASDGKSN